MTVPIPPTRRHFSVDVDGNLLTVGEDGSLLLLIGAARV